MPEPILQTGQQQSQHRSATRNRHNRSYCILFHICNVYLIMFNNSRRCDCRNIQSTYNAIISNNAPPPCSVSTHNSEDNYFPGSIAPSSPRHFPHSSRSSVPAPHKLLKIFMQAHSCNHSLKHVELNLQL